LKIEGGQLWMRKRWWRTKYRYVTYASDSFVKFERRAGIFAPTKTVWLPEFAAWAQKATLTNPKEKTP
jgi:hypothetical protein